MSYCIHVERKTYYYRSHIRESFNLKKEEEEWSSFPPHHQWIKKELSTRGEEELMN